MGGCDSRDRVDYVPCVKLDNIEECGSSPLLNIQASLQRIPSIAQLSTPSIGAEQLNKTRISCPRSLPTKKRDPSVEHSYQASSLFPKPISIPTSLSKWAKRHAFSPSRSKSVGSCVDFPWNAMCSMESRSSRTSESSRRRSLSSLLRDFVEDEQILLATLFAQIGTPRGRAASACLHE